MIAEIITIGDELLNGTHVNTNSVYLARRLDTAGLEVAYITTTGDDPDRLVEAIHLALRRTDVVIATGGLGPTDDDVTKKAICKAFKRNLIFHESVLEEMQKRFAARGVKMPSINQNQALLPQGAKLLANRLGSAMGIIIEEGGKFFCAMPGVPIEMQVMTDEELAPLLRLKAGSTIILHHRIRTAGITESALAEKIRPALKFSEGMTLAYLPSVRGVDLNIRSSGTVKEEVQAGIDLMAGSIRDVAGDFIYTEDDRELEQVVGELLIEKRLTLAVAESCTGGLLGGRLTSIPGSSAYFKGGLIVYSNDVKINRLGVPRETIEQFGAVSAETAQAMAVGATIIAAADIGVAVTGIAGPSGGTPEKAVGTVYVGLAAFGKGKSERFVFGGDRDSIRERAVTTALNMLRKELIGAPDRKM